jgi:uncharacterized membrane protein
MMMLFCYALSVSGLGWRDMWYDEVGDFMIAAEPIPGILPACRAGSLDPPLYYYLLHSWKSVAGRSEIALRFPSVLLTLLTVAFTFAWAKRWLGFRAGWSAALLLGTMPPVIYYAQEVNQYAGLVFFSSLAVWAAVRSDGSDTSHWQDYLLFALVSAAGLAWHYGFVWCWLALQLTFLFRCRDRGQLVRWVAFQAIPLALGAALFLFLFEAQSSVGSIPVYLEPAYPAAASLSYLLRFYGTAWLNILAFFMGGYYARSITVVYAGIGVQMAGMIVGWLAALRSPSRPRKPLVYLITLGVLLMAASLFRSYPFYGGRHLMMLAPLVAAALAWAWGALPRPLAGLGLLATVGVFALCWPHSWAAAYTHGDNTRALLAYLQSSVQPEDGLYVSAESIRTWRYYGSDLFPGARTGQWWVYNHLDGMLDEMDAVVAGSPRTWLVFSSCMELDGACATLFEGIPDRYCELSRWQKGQSRAYLVQSCP